MKKGIGKVQNKKEEKSSKVGRSLEVGGMNGWMDGGGEAFLAVPRSIIKFKYL